MKCERVREIFSEYIQGELGNELTADVSLHVESCASCGAELKLLRQTWGMLDALPEVEPPVDFRHDVVMRIARLQHERSTKTFAATQQSIWDMLRIRFSPSMSRVALTCAAAVLASFVLKIPQNAYQYVSSALVPGFTVTQNADTDKVSDGLDTSTMHQLSSDRKHEWMSNKLGRNSLWIDVSSKVDTDGRILYRVLLSINKDGLMDADTTKRIGANVYLLPPGSYTPDAVQSAQAIWSGSIITDSPVLVPVIVDKAQSSAGSVNLLVTWRFHQRDFAQMIFIPSMEQGSQNNVYSTPIDSAARMSGSDDLYSGLQKIAQYYGVPVIVNANLDTKSVIAECGRGSVDEALTSALKPNGLNWLVADKVVYVDRRHCSY